MVTPKFLSGQPNPDLIQRARFKAVDESFLTAPSVSSWIFYHPNLDIGTMCRFLRYKDFNVGMKRSGRIMDCTGQY